MKHMSDFEQQLSADLLRHRAELEARIDGINAALREIHIADKVPIKRPRTEMRLNAGAGVIQERVAA
jgi:LPS O-antigen subunit length determinant protein (WzzB/FepE family)